MPIFAAFDLYEIPVYWDKDKSGSSPFSDNSDDVILGEKIVTAEYRKNGIVPCVKHFPGHGDANADSHLTLPEINMDFAELENIHIKPFRYAINDGIEMVMVAHLHVPHFEKDIIPTSLSRNAIDYLRNKLGFKGVIVSDDMIMKGVAKFGGVQACEMGIRAGLNMFIYRNSTPEIINIIDTIAQKAENDTELRENIEKSYELIIKLKQEKNI